jgi:DNA-binding NtrC family response regulator
MGWKRYYSSPTIMTHEPKARLLSACRRSGILASRNEILERAGYAVVAAQGLDTALQALDAGEFDLVVVGHLYTESEKNLIADKARRRGLKVLCMYSEAAPPDVPAADEFIHNLEKPTELLAHVARLLDQHR